MRAIRRVTEIKVMVLWLRSGQNEFGPGRAGYDQQRSQEPRAKSGVKLSASKTGGCQVALGIRHTTFYLKWGSFTSDSAVHCDSMVVPEPIDISEARRRIIAAKQLLT